MTRRIIPACVALAALCLPAAAAAAKLPSFPSNSIVIKKSIGGVALGQSAKKAKSAWGSGKGCTSSKGFDACTYDGGASGNAQWTAIDGKVVDMHVNVASDGGRPNFKSPLAALKTSKGIGLGSTYKAVKQAYPGGLTDDQHTYWGLQAGRMKPFTTFIFSNGRVIQINTGDGKHQG